MGAVTSTNSKAWDLTTLVSVCAKAHRTEQTAISNDTRRFLIICRS